MGVGVGNRDMTDRRRRVRTRRIKWIKGFGKVGSLLMKRCGVVERWANFVCGRARRS